MFEIKPYIPEYYQELSGWWTDWNWQPVPEFFLPPDGIVISHADKNICAAFIYQTNTPICWAENYISCKDCDKTVRQQALDLLIETVINQAKDFGFRVIMSSINHPALGRRLENNGFVVSDKNMTAYMRGL